MHLDPRLAVLIRVDFKHLVSVSKYRRRIAADLVTYAPSRERLLVGVSAQSRRQCVSASEIQYF